MEFLRRILKQITGQLGDLNTSQRLIIALLLVIMAGAIMMMVRFAAERETVPLLNQSFTEDELSQISNALAAMGEDHEVRASQIWVAKSRQRQIIARLGYNQVLPKDTSTGWELLLKDTDIWTPDTVRKDKKKIILQMELARDISSWPNIENAKVFINEAGRPKVSDLYPAASASVSIETKSGYLASAKLATAIANFVSGPVSRMKPQDVKIVANGTLVVVRDPDDLGNGDAVAEKIKHEKLYRNRILQLIPVPDAIVEVNVVLDNSRTRKVENKFRTEEEGGSFVVITNETSRSEESSQTQKNREPGIIANNVPSTSPDGSRTPTQTSEETVTESKPFVGNVTVETTQGPGEIKDIAASILIPDSYFVDMARSADGQEPDAIAVEALRTDKLAAFKRSVMPILGLQSPTDDQKVVVETYWAMGTVAQAAGEGQDIEAGSALKGITARYGKHIAVSTLAMISLFMAMMMVRKSVGPVKMTDEEAITMMTGNKPLDALGLEDSNITEEGAGDGLLAGLELDEETVRSQQILQQIRELVIDTPDTAANLVGNWITQED